MSAGRAVPAWFEDAKLGILIHWGPYTVPAWADPSGDFHTVSKRHGWEYWFAHNAYPEWYMNTLLVPGSAARAHHDATWGRDFPYERFAPMFEAAARAWRADDWARCFAAAGARYAILVTKHHDGFTLWPSGVANPHRDAWNARRDYVAEFTEAMRAHGVRAGLYYSGGLDWTFEGAPIATLPDMFARIPQSAEYLRYADAHWRELFARYRPSVAWNDIGYPKDADLARLFADYYAAVPDGVVNDRFRWGDPAFGDFRTLEYATTKTALPVKWETTRGFGFAFGYNANEPETNALSLEALVHLLADVVSKNGNLLLGVGPKADGSLPVLQRERLEALGDWLARSGEAIFATRPWRLAEGRTDDGLEVRFTARGDALYAIVLGAARTARLALCGLRPRSGGRVTLLGVDGPPLAHRGTPEALELTLPAPLPAGPAFALRIEPAPEAPAAA